MIDYLLLGLVQGVTEFLPISSSGHLILAERLLGLAPPGLIVEAALHLGSVAAMLVAFRGEILELFRALTPRGRIEARKEIGCLLLATAPIVAAGLAMRSFGDGWYRSLWVLGAGWLLTGGVLLAASRRARRAKRAVPSAAGSLAIGVAQALAMAPGASRSGLTIGTGILTGLGAERATRFSFLLAIPAVAGAACLSIADGAGAGVELGGGVFWGTVIGAATAFVVGLAAVRVLLALVRRGTLWPFAAYCLAASILAFSLALAGRA